MSKEDFILVPRSVNDITTEWCNEVLHCGKCISSEMYVSQVKVENLTDGEGLSGAQMVRLQLTYSGDTDGSEPASMICKLSGNYQRSPPIVLRFFTYFFSMKYNMDEYFAKQEALFYDKAVKQLQECGYKTPTPYFIGVDDKKGKSSFTQYVILNKPPKIRSVILMEDMGTWKSMTNAQKLSKSQVMSCLKNVAILHAKFWKDKKSFQAFGLAKAEKDQVTARHSKFAYKMRQKSIAKIGTMKKKLLEGKWPSALPMRLPEESLKPDWLTVPLGEDGTYPVLTDSLVLEMLDEMEKKFPEFNQKKSKPFLRQPPQSILHGDFHAGNHLYGNGPHEGQVAAIDFQMFGYGLVSFEFVYLLLISFNAKNFTEIEEFIRGYHLELTKNGVKDYSLDEFLSDVKVSLAECVLKALNDCSGIEPEKFLNTFKQIFGEEKSEGMMKIFNQGLLANPFLVLTSLYVSDKKKFLSIE